MSYTFFIFLYNIGKYYIEIGYYNIKFIDGNMFYTI